MYVVLLFLLLVAIFIILILIIGIHQKSTNAICISRRRLEGRTVLVTGGTAGMGLEIAKDLANRGAKVIIACPFEEEGESARKHIVQETENENVVFKLLNLASLTSVREFAADILASEDRLDVLVNNAGVGVPRDSVTADGMHFIMQVNYYGGFLLTFLLLPLMKKTGTVSEPSRIILTTSVLHHFGRIDFENMNKKNYWYKLQIYSTSKLCLILFGSELSRRLKSTNVVVNCVDPGAVGTRIFDSGYRVVGMILKVFFNYFFKTTWQGAQTALHVALDKKAGEVSGMIFKNCEIYKAVPRAPVRWSGLTDISCFVPEDKLYEMLWIDSIRLVKLENHEVEQCF